MTSGQRIYKCRKTKKLSQQYVADMLGVSRQAVSKWENDTSTPDTVHYINLAKIFGVSVEYLAFGEVELAVPVDSAPAEEKNVQTPVTQAAERIAEETDEKEKTVLSLIIGMLVFMVGAVAFVYAIFFTNSLLIIAISVLFVILGKRIALD